MPDLRTWLDEVDKLGQLMTVENVHWDLELSTLTEIINERSKTRPAIVFDKIRDYPPGYRVAANLVSSTDRLALTLGMEAGLSDMDFIQAWRRQVKKIMPLTAATVSGVLKFTIRPVSSVKAPPKPWMTPRMKPCASPLRLIDNPQPHI